MAFRRKWKKKLTQILVLWSVKKRLTYNGINTTNDNIFDREHHRIPLHSIIYWDRNCRHRRKQTILRRKGSLWLRIGLLIQADEWKSLEELTLIVYLGNDGVVSLRSHSNKSEYSTCYNLLIKTLHKRLII